MVLGVVAASVVRRWWNHAPSEGVGGTGLVPLIGLAHSQ